MQTNLTEKQKLRCFINGSICALFCALFGSGGGVYGIYSLKKIGLPTKKAHATCVFSILPISIISTIFYFRNGNLTIIPLLYILPGSLAGTFAGTFFFKKINRTSLTYIFSAIMIIAGLYMVIA